MQNSRLLGALFLYEVEFETSVAAFQCRCLLRWNLERISQILFQKKTNLGDCNSELQFIQKFTITRQSTAILVAIAFRTQYSIGT